MPSNSYAATWLKKLYPGKAASEFVARAYRNSFRGEYGAAVMLDLQKACHQLDTTATKSGAMIDPIQLNINEGRRQAYLHIAAMLEVSGADLSLKGPTDYDHRDERREPAGHDDDRAGYTPRFGAGFDPDLDGPISSTGANGGADSGDSSSGGGGE